MDNITKGVLIELYCITYFLEHNYNVSIPQKPDRYDFILDTGKTLLKIQVKACRLKDDNTALTFATASSRKGYEETIHHKYTADEIDYFCIYYNSQCYLIPVKECDVYEKTLRLCRPKNNQTKNISFLQDYTVESILGSII